MLFSGLPFRATGLLGTADDGEAVNGFQDRRTYGEHGILAVARLRKAFRSEIRKFRVGSTCSTEFFASGHTGLDKIRLV